MRDNKKEKAMGYTIENPRENPMFMAATTRAHLRMIALGGQPRRGIRKGDVLDMASNLTGIPYKRGEYKAAIADLTELMKIMSGWRD